jgi:acetylornithine deacetylase/succinyl-diaminopimelate desuccinylase-like protein
MGNIKMKKETQIEWDMRLTPKLVLEGWWNEIRHQIMRMRKENKLTKDDKIRVAISHVLTYKEAEEIAKKHNENIGYYPGKGWVKKNTQEKH